MKYTIFKDKTISKYDQERFIEVVNMLKEKYGNRLIFVALQGSQNYNLNKNDKKYNSDVDVKAFILPSGYDLLKKQQTSKTLNTQHGIATIHDIRMLSDLIKKCNLSYIELFYSSIFTIRSDFYKVFFEIRKIILENLLEDRRYILLKSLYGTLKSKYDKCFETFNGKLTYSIKEITHYYRLAYLFEIYKKYDFKNYAFLLALRYSSLKDLYVCKNDIIYKLFKSKTIKKDESDIISNISVKLDLLKSIKFSSNDENTTLSSLLILMNNDIEKIDISDKLAKNTDEEIAQIILKNHFNKITKEFDKILDVYNKNTENDHGIINESLNKISNLIEQYAYTKLKLNKIK